MPDPAVPPRLDEPARDGGRWRRTVALILIVTAVRLIYLYLLCPYNLVEDEATYWEWSRRLEWSYYTKGPGIALAIRGATSLLGESEAAIRTVSVVAGAIAALAVGALGREAFRRRTPDGQLTPPDDQVGFLSAALFMLMPIFQVVGLLATIDGPYVACWAVAAWSAFMALERRTSWAWVTLGAAVGVGFLFKYTVLLLIPGLAFYAIARRGRLNASRSPAMILLGLVLMAAGLAPVLIWNAQHGWPTIAHLLGHLGVKGGDMPVAAPGAKREGYNPLWTLDFLGTQLAAVGPALVLGIGLAVNAIRHRRLHPDRWSNQLYLISCSVPILVFYLLVSIFTEPEGNWAMGGYITLAVLAAGGIPEGMVKFKHALATWESLPAPRPKAGFFRKRPEIFSQVLWRHSIAYGLGAALLLARVDLLVKAVAPSSAGRVGSLMTAVTLAQDAKDRADAVRARTGLEPFYIAQHYGRASILAYYIPGHPNVRCSSSRMGGRPTQYDYWSDTRLDDPSLLGRPAILVGATEDQWNPLFDHVRPIGRLRGEHKKVRDSFIGYGYKGWPDPAHPATPRETAPDLPKD